MSTSCLASTVRNSGKRSAAGWLAKLPFSGATRSSACAPGRRYSGSSLK